MGTSWAEFWTSDGYHHFRVCEGDTAHFECYNNKKLHLGGCWYGAPIGDAGYHVCTHNGNCNVVVGDCVSYLWGECEGQYECDVTINNDNMGGDPCFGTYKFGGIALQCN